jgi:hypothetical protein
VIDDVVEGFEDPVRQPVPTHELPYVLWLLSSGERGGNGRYPEFFGAVPSAQRNLGGDLVEMKLHGFAVAGR